MATLGQYLSSLPGSNTLISSSYGYQVSYACAEDVVRLVDECILLKAKL